MSNKNQDLYLQINDSQETQVDQKEKKQSKVFDASQPKKKGFSTETISSFRRLLTYTWRHKFLLFMANFALAVTALALVALPLLTGQIIDAIAKGSDATRLNTLSFEFIFVFAIAALFGFIRGTSYNLIGEKVVIQIRNELFGKLLEKDVEFFDQNRSGELVSRITSDVSLIQSAASDTISMLVRNLFQFIGSLCLLWFISWQLTLIMIVVIPPFAIVILLFARQFKKLTKEYQDKVSLSTQIATEALSNMRVVKSFSMEIKEVQQFSIQTNEAYLVGKKKAFLYGFFTGIGMLLAYLVLLGILWYGGHLVLKGEISIGALTSFVMYAITMTTSVLGLGGTLNTIATATAAAEKVFELMDTEIKIQNGSVQFNNFNGNIEFNNVEFNYPTKQNVQVLKKINFQIKQGEVVAFVGQSGSGKSTIVSLIERFYDANSGSINFDGINVKELELRSLHKEIGFVSQEPTLFSGTLEQNITYGVMDYTMQDIDTSLKLANAYDFVKNQEIFPEGLQTIVGERGVKLSGGQKQRIAIARALIKNPKVLIFDEATSALDAESEYQVQQAIDGLVEKANKTIIIIAHRLSTVINASKIIVLQQGEIVEIGNHQELVQMNGYYRQLIDRQLSNI